MGPGPHRWLLATAPWAGLAVLATALSLQDIRSLDYWWHLRAGELIAATGEIPRSDPFTYTVPGARWIDIHWLHQLGLHALYAMGGHAAVVLGQLAQVLVWLAALAPIGARRERAWLGAGALALMLLVTANRLQARPELPSFVLLAGVLLCLDRFERTGDRSVYAIVALELLWVNLHGLFAVGIALCAIHLAGELLRPFGRPGEGLRRERVRRLAAVTALAALVSLANPNGLDGALYPLPQLDMVGSAERRGSFGVLVDELRPTFGSLRPLSLGLFLALATLSLGAILANRHRVREADLLAWVAFFTLAIGANRNAALFAVVAAPMLVRNLNEVLDARPPALRLHAVASALAVTFTLLVAFDAARGRFFARIGPYSTPGIGVIEGMNPIGAAEWIDRARPPAPIAHSMGDGGYLIWRLWPAYQVMSDGRLEVFGPELLPRLQLSDAEGFASLDARYRFGTLLLNHRRKDVGDLAGWLHASPEWRLVYLDDVSLVFVREPAGAARWRAIDLDAPGLFAPLDGAAEIPARERLIARTRLLRNLGRPDLAARAWEEVLARFPDTPHGRQALAQLRAEAAARAAPERAGEPAAPVDALAPPPRRTYPAPP
jgi:hypothetical protein